MRILVNTSIKSRAHKGGVNNHWWGLHPYWREDVRYNTYGKRFFNAPGSAKIWIAYDVLKFIFVLLIWRPEVVVVNPSIMKNALNREFIYVKIAIFFRCKTIVFIHGFNLDNYAKLNKQKLIRRFNKATGIIVLAEHFKNLLQADGVIVPIEVLTTKVDDRLIETFDINRRDGDIKNILILGRVEKTKGIYEAIETYKLLKKIYPYLRLTIVGSGAELNNVKEEIEKNDIKDVTVTGALSGDALIEEFKSADCFLFPSYSEGMPTSVLEAMAFGLPIFTRNVGGLSDFFDDENMGFITDSFDPNDFATAISRYIQDRELTKKVSLYNHQYAKEHFMASKVATQTENAIKRIVEHGK